MRTLWGLGEERRGVVVTLVDVGVALPAVIMRMRVLRELLALLVPVQEVAEVAQWVEEVAEGASVILYLVVVVVPAALAVVAEEEGMELLVLLVIMGFLEQEVQGMEMVIPPGAVLVAGVRLVQEVRVLKDLQGQPKASLISPQYFWAVVAVVVLQAMAAAAALTKTVLEQLVAMEAMVVRVAQGVLVEELFLLSQQQFQIAVRYGQMERLDQQEVMDLVAVLHQIKVVVEAVAPAVLAGVGVLAEQFICKQGPLPQEQ